MTNIKQQDYKKAELELLNEIKNSQLVVVEDSDIDFAIVENILSDSYQLIRFADAESALQALPDLTPDLILLDYRLPGMNGAELCQTLRNDFKYKTIPIIMLTGETYVSYETSFWQAGCSDFVCKPYTPATLVHRVAHQLKYKALLDEYKDAAMVDTLTKVFNRRYLESIMTQINTRAKTPELSLLLIDVDWFKRYNDEYGHLAGDLVLVSIADVLKGSLQRDTDFVSRWGGEEFSVVMPHTQKAGCELVATKIRENLRGMSIEHRASPIGYITVSVGDVTYAKPPENWQSMLQIADDNLYKVKETGRSNQIITLVD